MNITNLLYDFPITAISDNIRNVARQDIVSSILLSNRELEDTYGLKLKSPADINRLALNTEASIFQYKGRDPKQYIETVLTYITFLTDPMLSQDAMIFRMLLNTDLDDLFLIANPEELLFMELIHCDIDKLNKFYYLSSITSNIKSNITQIAYDYCNGQRYISKCPLNYNRNRHILKAMKAYRDRHLGKIINRISPINNLDDVTSLPHSSDTDSGVNSFHEYESDLSEDESDLSDVEDESESSDTEHSFIFVDNNSTKSVQSVPTTTIPHLSNRNRARSHSPLRHGYSKQTDETPLSFVSTRTPVSSKSVGTIESVLSELSSKKTPKKPSEEPPSLASLISKKIERGPPSDNANANCPPSSKSPSLISLPKSLFPSDNSSVPSGQHLESTVPTLPALDDDRSISSLSDLDLDELFPSPTHSIKSPCHTCGTNCVTQPYCIPVVCKGGVCKVLTFCSAKCAENWTPKRVKIMG